MGQNDVLIQRYLEEGLVALLPEYREKEGGTQIFTLQGAYQDSRSLPWLAEVLSRFYWLDLAAVRRHTGRMLELRHHIPLPLAEGLVLLPIKVRQAAVLGEHTAGYVNLLHVERVEAVEGGVSDRTSSAAAEMVRDESSEGAPSVTDQMVYIAVDAALIRSRIVCRGSLIICCLNTAATVKAKLHQGEMALQELLYRQRLTTLPDAKFTGLDGGALRALLPSCDCLLSNILLLLLDKASRPVLEPERRKAAATAGAGKE